MIKYLFKVEKRFIDKNTDEKVEEGSILEITDEKRLQELNKGKAGRVIKATYIEAEKKSTKKGTKTKEDKAEIEKQEEASNGKIINEEIGEAEKEDTGDKVEE